MGERSTWTRKNMKRQRKRRSRASSSDHEPSPPPPPPPHHHHHHHHHHIILQALISALQSSFSSSSPQSLKPSLLKSLYVLLVRLSSGKPDSSSIMSCLADEDIVKLSDILFKELSERSQQFFSALHAHSTNQEPGRTMPLKDLWGEVENLILLLRCCLSVLPLLSFNQKLILEKAQVLHSILRILVLFTSSGKDEDTSIVFRRFHREHNYVEDGYSTSVAEDLVASLQFLQHSVPRYSLFSGLLEVFVDELLSGESLRDFFVYVESTLSPSEKLFVCDDNHQNIGILLEVMSSHFMLLVSDEEAIEITLERINGHHVKKTSIPKLSLTAALALLLNPVVLSAPKMFQAHSILLVSEVIGAAAMPCQGERADLGEMDWYLAAFERSVHLYRRHMSSFTVEGYSSSAEDPFSYLCARGSTQPTFQSCIRQVTKEKLDLSVAKLETLWNSYMQNMVLESKSDMLSASLAYAKDMHDVLDWSYKDEILSVLECIILKAFSDDPSSTVLHKYENVSFQDIYLLSSILKLMSYSMFRAVQCLRHSGYMVCEPVLQNLYLQRQHNFLLHMIRCFQHLNVHLPCQPDFCEIMKAKPLRHEEPIWTLLHFAQLLSCCMVTRLDFLVKVCLFMIMTILNLPVLEEGDLVTIRSLLSLEGESSSHGIYCKEKVPGVEDASEKVALTFQKIQGQCFSFQEVQGDTPSSSMDMECNTLEGTTEETCNGEIFLKCLLEHSGQSSDYSDLVDFIEVKKGKDYEAWLRNREKYRRRKSEKMAVLRWKKKKMVWRMMKGKN